MQKLTPALRGGRWRFCLTVLGAGAAAALPRVATAQERRYTVAFANLTEEPCVTIEGTGFTGP